MNRPLHLHLRLQLQDLQVVAATRPTKVVASRPMNVEAPALVIQLESPELISC